MHIVTKTTFGRFAGYLWLCCLAFILVLSARSAYRQSLQTEEYPHSCDPFGYLEMAKEIRESAPRLRFPTFKIESPQTRLLINLMQSKDLPPPVWNNLVGPHAYHYFPKAGHVGVQYPPGTSLTLALFPEGKAVYWLNFVVVSLLLVAGLAGLLLAAFKQAWASAGLVVLAAFVGFEILIRLGSLSFSINVVMIPLLLASLLSFAALWLKNDGSPRLAWLAAFGVGLCLGFTILVRLTSIFFVPGFLILLWSSSGWRSAVRGLTGAMCLALLLGGLIPLFVHQQLTAGAWYVSTYSPSVHTNLPTLEIIKHNFSYYFGTGYQTEDNWSLLYLLAGFAGWVLYVYVRTYSARSDAFGIGWKRLAASAAMLWALPTAFFLTQSLTGLHYMMAQNFGVLTLVGFGTLAIESSAVHRKFSGLHGKRLVVSYIALILTFLPPVECFTRSLKQRVMTPTPSGPVTHQPVVLPPDLADAHAWIWADLLTGTLWYYDRKAAFRVRFSNPEIRAMVYRYVQARGEPQYIIRDSEFIDEMMAEITRMGGTFEPRGRVDGQPYYLVHWPEEGPRLSKAPENNAVKKS